jgi:hypothetical protein
MHPWPGQPSPWPPPRLAAAAAGRAAKQRGLWRAAPLLAPPPRWLASAVAPPLARQTRPARRRCHCRRCAGWENQWGRPAAPRAPTQQALPTPASPWLGRLPASQHRRRRQLLRFWRRHPRRGGREGAWRWQPASRPSLPPAPGEEWKHGPSLAPARPATPARLASPLSRLYRA